MGIFWFVGYTGGHRGLEGKVGGMAKLNKLDATENLASEYSWGPGLFPNRSAGSSLPSTPGNPGGEAALTAFERARATRMTDPANPEANEQDVYSVGVTHSSTNADGTWKPGTLREGVTTPVRVGPGLPTGGQHGKIYSDRFNPGHEPDGVQNGEGAAWRDSVPPNPKY